MIFPTTEQHASLNVIREKLLADPDQRINEIGEVATDLQLFIMIEAHKLASGDQQKTADYMQFLFDQHRNLAEELEVAEDMGLL